MIAKCFAQAWILLALSTGHAWSQNDLPAFTGVWTTPLTGLASPSGVTGDSSGNLYVTDTSLTSVIKLTSGGTQSTVGSGLSAPGGVATDAAGNLYVSSSADNKVYQITPGGIQTAIGSGWSTPWSLAVDASGTLWVTDSNGLSTVTTGGTQTLVYSGVGTRGVTIDAGGNVYFGDNNDGQIYQLAGGTGAPVGLAFANSVQGLYIDANASVYVAEGSNSVYQIDQYYGDYTLFGNTSISAAVWGDSHQNLYIADAAGLVEKLALGPVDFGSVHVCPTGATVTPCSSSLTLNFAEDNIFSSDLVMSALSEGMPALDYTFSADGCTGTVFDGTSCAVTVSFAPQAAGLRTGAVEAVGDDFCNCGIASPVGPHPRAGHAVHPHDSGGTLLNLIALHGIGLAPVGVFNTAPIQTGGYTPLANAYPYGLTVAANGDVYVTDYANCVVQKSSANVTTIVAGTVCGAVAGDGGPATSAVLSGPVRTAIDGAGDLYIADEPAHTVREVDALTGNIFTVAGNGSNGYSGDGGPALSASFEVIEAVVLDAVGNGYIADYGSNVVRRVDAVTGIITTLAGTGAAGYTGDTGPAASAELDGPDALALDTANNLYIADDGNNVIRKVNLDTGVITTVAGTGTSGYSGDDGPATSAEINDPEGIAVDMAGNLYIADAQNHVVRVVDATTGIIGTAAGQYGAGTETYTGDGGPAIAAGMSYLEDVSFAANGRLYITDADNGVVRLVQGPIGLANFASTAIGSSSRAQDTVLVNAGNSALIVGGLQVPTNFSLGGADTTCIAGSTLTAGGYCVLGIEFAPTADGTLTGTLNVTDNFGDTPAAQQAITLTGTGSGTAAAKLAFSGAPGAIAAGGNLGTVTVNVEDSTGKVVAGSSATVTLTITGPGGFSQTVTVTAVNGVASFTLGSLALTTPGTYTLTATSTGLTLATATFTVTAGSSLAIVSTVPVTVGAGGNLGAVTVDIHDSSGTVIAGATNSVTLTLTGPGGFSYAVTVAAVNGVASFDLSSVLLSAPGTYTLTATSARLSAAIATFTVTVDFTIAVTTGTPSTGAIPPGAATGFSFTLAPVTGSFSSPITVTATGVPAGATWHFSPSTVTPGAGPAATTMSIQTLRTASASLRTGAGTLALALLLLPISALRRARSAWRRAGMMSIVLLLLGGVAGLSGCGSGGLFGQPQQSYAITVTGTSGQISHSATVTLVVE